MLFNHFSLFPIFQDFAAIQWERHNYHSLQEVLREESRNKREEKETLTLLSAMFCVKTLSLYRHLVEQRDIFCVYRWTGWSVEGTCTYMYACMHGKHLLYTCVYMLYFCMFVCIHALWVATIYCKYCMNVCAMLYAFTIRLNCRPKYVCAIFMYTVFVCMHIHVLCYIMYVCIYACMHMFVCMHVCIFACMHVHVLCYMYV